MNSSFCSRLAFVGLVALTGASWGASEVRAEEGGGVPGFTFRVIINTDKSLVVQTTTNSVDWQGLFQVASPGGGFAVVDPATETNFMQFFRAVDPEVPPFVINSSFPDLQAAKWGFNTSRFVDTSVTTNHVLRFGWNAEETDPNQPVWVQRFESDWATPNGDRLMEWYLTHRNTNGEYVRPIMVTVSRLTQEVRGNLAGEWSFVNPKDPGKQVMIVQTDPIPRVTIGRAPRTNLFEVYSETTGETMFLGGVARGIPDVASLNFYAQNGANAPTYARLSLGVVNGAAGQETGNLGFWTRFSGVMAERARLLYNGNFGIGNTEPAFKLDVDGDVRIRGSSALRFGGNNGGTDTAIFRSGSGLLTLDANVIMPAGRSLSVASLAVGSLAVGSLAVGSSDAGGSGLRFDSGTNLLTLNANVIVPAGRSLSVASLAVGSLAVGSLAVGSSDAGGSGLRFDSGTNLLTLDANVIVPTGRYLSVGTPDARGSEVRIYRSADDLATVEGALALRRNNTTSLALGAFTASDSQFRLAIMADGGLFFGSGLSAPDVFLGRSGPRTLAVGTSAAPGDLNVFGAAQVRVRNTTTMTAVPGRFHVNATLTKSTNTTVSTLRSVSVPGGTFTKTGDALEMRCSGFFGPSGGAKTLNLHYGNSLVFTTGSQAFINASWVITAEIVRAGTTAQIVNVTFASDSSLLRSSANVTVTAEDNAASNQIRFTASGDVTGAVNQRTCTIDWKPAN